MQWQEGTYSAVPMFIAKRTNPVIGPVCSLRCITRIQAVTITTICITEGWMNHVM